MIFTSLQADESRIILASGGSQTLSKLFIGYLKVVKYFTNWYIYDPFDPQSPSYKAHKLVRRMHEKVNELYDNKEYHNYNDGRRIWLNQYYMSATHFMMYGLAILFPKECGLHQLTRDDFQCLIHFGRVIGYCLGIEDRFNVYNGDLDECRAMLEVMTEKEIRKNFKNQAPSDIELVGIELGKGIAIALEQLNYHISWFSLMKHWHLILGVHKEIPLPKWSDRFKYQITLFTFNHLCRSPFGQRFLNQFSKILIKIALHRKQNIIVYLGKEYQNLKYRHPNVPDHAYGEKLLILKNTEMKFHNIVNEVNNTYHVYSR